MNKRSKTAVWLPIVATLLFCVLAILSGRLQKQEAIERVLAAKGRESLPPALRETAALRLAHPEMSLEELGRLCDPPVGKSGINHRLRKLEIMAQELDGQETAENAGEGKADGADD